MQITRIIRMFTVFLPLFIYSTDETANKVKPVTITTPQGTFERPLYNCKWTIINLTPNVIPVPSAPIASKEEFEYVAEIQQRVPGAPKAPIVLFDTGQESPCDDGDLGMKVRAHDDDNGNADLYMSAMPLQKYQTSEKRFLVGHEVMHLEYHKNSTLALANIEQSKAIEQRSKREVLALYVGMGGFMGLTCKAAFKETTKKSVSLTDIVYTTMLVGGASWYLFNRMKGYHAATASHAEELACDRFAVNTGKTPQEKIDIAKSGIHLFKNKYDALTDVVVPIIFTTVHPSYYVRTKQLSSMIREQQSILNKMNIEALSNSFGVSITL